jgi:hypothetical protein
MLMISIQASYAKLQGCINYHHHTERESLISTATILLFYILT